MMEDCYKTDKQLIREGKYQLALGENYDPKPYYILPFYNGMDSEPDDEIDEKFFNAEDAEYYCKKNNITDYIIGNSNHDWL